MKKIDITTPKQRERKARQAKVLADFQQIKLATKAADNRIFASMAESGNYGYRCASSIRNVILKAQGK